MGKMKGGGALKKWEKGMGVFKVGFRNRVRFWKDKWCDDTSLRELFLELDSIATSKDAWVGDLWDDGSWSSRFTRQLVAWLGIGGGRSLFWEVVYTLHYFGDWRCYGMFACKEWYFFSQVFYYYLTNRRTELFPCDIIWNFPLKISFFAWKATWAKILTLD